MVLERQNKKKPFCRCFVEGKPFTKYFKISGIQTSSFNVIITKVPNILFLFILIFFSFPLTLQMRKLRNAVELSLSL